MPYLFSRGMAGAGAASGFSEKRSVPLLPENSTLPEKAVRVLQDSFAGGGAVDGERFANRPSAGLVGVRLVPGD